MKILVLNIMVNFYVFVSMVFETILNADMRDGEMNLEYACCVHT